MLARFYCTFIDCLEKADLMPKAFQVDQFFMIFHIQMLALRHSILSRLSYIDSHWSYLGLPIRTFLKMRMNQQLLGALRTGQVTNMEQNMQIKLMSMECFLN